MRAIWTLARKEFALLLRDRLAALILLAMPLLFILVLGLLVGDDFGQQSKLRIPLVVLDTGAGPSKSARPIPDEKWAEVVRRDLAETGGIELDPIASLEEAKHLIAFHKRAAIVVFETDFSEKVDRCSFLADGINPFYRDGVLLPRVDVKFLSDPMQPGSSAIVEQVVQVSLLRVLMPWMISKAFARLSDQQFIQILGEKVNLPVPEKLTIPRDRRFLFGAIVPLDKKGRANFMDLLHFAGVDLHVDKNGNAKLNDLLGMAAQNDPAKMKEYRTKVGQGVQTPWNSSSGSTTCWARPGPTWSALPARPRRNRSPAQPARKLPKDRRCSSVGQPATRCWCRPTR